MLAKILIPPAAFHTITIQIRLYSLSLSHFRFPTRSNRRLSRRAAIEIFLIFNTRRRVISRTYSCALLENNKSWEKYFKIFNGKLWAHEFSHNISGNEISWFHDSFDRNSSKNNLCTYRWKCESQQVTLSEDKISTDVQNTTIFGHEL